MSIDKKFNWLNPITVAIALASMSLFGCSDQNGTTQTYKLVTGPQGGAWYPLGGALKALIENGQSEIKVQVLPGGGVSNALALHTGQAQIALAQSWQTETAKTGPKVHIVTPDPMLTATRARFFPGEDRKPLAAPETQAKRILSELSI